MPIFHTPQLINDGGTSNQWKSLPTLPAGVDPMRRVILKASDTTSARAAAAFRVGSAAAGSTSDVTNFYVDSAGSMDLGFVNYNAITVRRNGGTTDDNGYIYVVSFSAMEQGPKGVS